MDANVGLHDGVAGLEWTRKYISRFGGDPDRITAFGESSGGALVNLMLTGDGGKGKLPFSQVSSYSPLTLRRFKPRRLRR
jgi:carboxylesterase type B